MAIGVEALLILILVIANGLFSMSEIAVVAARKSSLQQRAAHGSRRAQIALSLAESPNQFLSTVQIGITVIGTLAGAYGGLTISEKLAAYLSRFPWMAPYVNAVSFGAVVVTISYLSLIIGELVPKRIGLARPEAIALLVGPAMQTISKLTWPVVRFLTWSTDLVFSLIRLKHSNAGAVTEEEIRALIEQGTEAGVVQETEEEMVRGVFRLGDRRAIELMTPRLKVAWLDVSDSRDDVLRTVNESRFSKFPVCEGNLDQVIGIIHVKDLFVAVNQSNSLNLRQLVRPPLLVPETMQALKLLETLRASRSELALIIDEHGGVEGIITIADIFEAIVGDLSALETSHPQEAVQREDGSWLIDGMLPVAELQELPGIGHIPNDESVTTVGGLVMVQLGRIPRCSDTFNIGGLHFEVVDMDGKRVDKVLVTRSPSGESPHD